MEDEEVSRGCPADREVRDDGDLVRRLGGVMLTVRQFQALVLLIIE